MLLQIVSVVALTIQVEVLEGSNMEAGPEIWDIFKNGTLLILGGLDLFRIFSKTPSLLYFSRSIRRSVGNSLYLV